MGFINNRRLSTQHLAATGDDDATGSGSGDGTALEVVGGSGARISGGSGDGGRDDGLHVDVVDVRHPAGGVGQTDGVLTRLELDVKGLATHLVETAGIEAEVFYSLAVDADSDIARLTTEVADGELIVTTLLTVDVTPLEVVLSDCPK